MKFFLDTANLNEITAAVSLGFIDGVTTNPSLIAALAHPLTDAGIKRFLEDWQNANR